MASGVKFRAGTHVTVDATKFLTHLDDYAKVLGYSMADTIKKQAALFCYDMVRFTPPFSSDTPGDGQTLAARNHGRDNIKRSVFKLFRPLNLATKEQIADVNSFDVFKLWSKRKGETKNPKLLRWTKFQPKFSRGNRILYIDTPGQLAPLHATARGDGGRGPLKQIYRQKDSQPIAIVKNEKIIKDYIKSKIENVGALKSAWFHVAKNMNEDVSKFPAWVQNASGAANMILRNELGDAKMPTIEVGNTIGKRSMKKSSENFVQIALNYRAFAMRTAMAAKLNGMGDPMDAVKLWASTYNSGLLTGGRHNI